VLIDHPGKILTTERGVNYLRERQVPHQQIDLNKSTYFQGKEGEGRQAARKPGA